MLVVPVRLFENLQVSTMSYKGFKPTTNVYYR